MVGSFLYGRGHGQKIAIFRALQFGDLLCSIPALRAIRAALPEAQITLIGLPWQRALVERYSSLVDSFLWFPGHPGFPEQKAQLHLFPAFLRQAQEMRFDLALQMHGAGTIANGLTALFGAGRLAGFYAENGYCPDPDTFILYPNDGHEIHRQLRLIEHLGIPLQGDYLDFPLDAQDRAEWLDLAGKAGVRPGQYVCLHPGASIPEKRWPPERFAQLGDRLAGQGFQVVLTGVENERPLTQRVSDLMAGKAVDMAGKTSLGALGAAIEGARLLVCNDTGVSHLAAALRTPSVVLFINTGWQRWAPLDRRLHIPCLQAHLAPVEHVFKQAAALLEAARTGQVEATAEASQRGS